MKINRARLAASMEALGRVGETPRGGLTRLALSDEDRRGRDLLVGWMRDAGLTVTVDQMGNIFGLRVGTAALPPVLMGSHADSVPTGGKYDGQLGVLCALEVIRTLADRGARVDDVVAYEVVVGPESSRAPLARALADGLDAAVFTSGSTVHGFARLTGDPALALAGARVVCIGPVTAEAARRAGLGDVRVAAGRTPAAIVAALADAAGGEADG